MPTQYQPLAAGDVRQEGDEVRHKDYDLNPRWLHNKSTDKFKPGPWNPVNLLGHTILAIDLHVAEFRRPLP